MPLPLLALALSVAGCAAAMPPASVPLPTGSSSDPEDGLSRAVLGQTVAVGGPKVTPLAVIEDSRCPADVRCVWAGQVRISVRVDLGSGSQMHELTQGKPIPVADGTLELVEVQPGKGAKDQPQRQDYRFGFRFMGGL